MPHYKDGTEQIGDLVKGKVPWTSEPVLGVVVSIQPGASTCNMSIDRVERFFQLGPDGKPTSAVAVARPGGCFTIADFEKIA